MFATGNPEFPTRVVCLGSKNVHSDEGIPGTRGARLPGAPGTSGRVPQRPDHGHCVRHGRRRAARDLSFTGTMPRWKSAPAAKESR